MDSPSALQAQITPVWTDEELDAVLDPSVGVLESEAREQRNRLASAIEASDVDAPRDLESVLVEFVRWRNGNTAIALWAGHVDRADEMRGKASPFDDAEAVERSLVERVGQPAHNEAEVGAAQLVATVVPIVRASPVSQLRPELWADDERARERVRSVLEEELEILF